MRIWFVILLPVCGIYFSTGKLSEKISTWFSPSSGNGASTKDDRRNSEGGKSGSSFASKIRRSFRRRSRTISAGVSFIKTKTTKISARFFNKNFASDFSYQLTWRCISRFYSQCRSNSCQQLWQGKYGWFMTPNLPPTHSWFDFPAHQVYGSGSAFIFPSRSWSRREKWKTKKTGKMQGNL